MTRTKRSVMMILSASCASASLAQSSPVPSGTDSPAANAGPTTAAPTATTSNAVVGLDAITVTARKRSESVEDAPASIAVITATKLKSINVINPNELNGVVPGLVIGPAHGGVPAITFRGLGSNSALFSVESSIALFMDGMYYAHPRDYVTPMYDLSRIEAVKGTQGTLLGKNTALGAIQLISNRPRPDFGYSLSGSYDFSTHTPRLDGYINAPLTQTLWLRVAGIYNDDGGYIKNAFGHDQPQIRDISGRAELYWTPTTAFNALLTYQHDDRRERGQDLQMLQDGTGAFTVAAFAKANGQTNFEALPDNRTEIGSLPLGASTPGALGSTGPFDRQASNRLNFIANLDVGGPIITAQSSYTWWHRASDYDLDFTQYNLSGYYETERNREFTQEVRITSPSEDRFTYLAGAYLFKNVWDTSRTFYAYSPWPINGAVTHVYHQNDLTLSAFSEFGFKLTDKLTLSGGVRFTHEDKAGTLFRAQGTGTYGAQFPAIPKTTLHDRENTVDGDVGVQYKLGHGKMVYVSASKGSKAGGFQNSPINLAAAPYKGEVAYNFEAGIKSVFRRATLDVILFDTIDNGFQFSHAAFVGTPPTAVTVVDNSDVRSRGVDIAGSWLVTSTVKISGGIVYADAIATKNTPAPPATPVQVEGLRQPRAPKWSGNFDLNYHQPLTDELSIDALASVEFQTLTYLQPPIASTLNAPTRPGYAKLDLRLGIQSTKGWEIAMLVKNVNNTQLPLFVTPMPGVSGGYLGNLQRPRAFLLQLTLKH